MLRKSHLQNTVFLRYLFPYLINTSNLKRMKNRNDEGSNDDVSDDETDDSHIDLSSIVVNLDRKS